MKLTCDLGEGLDDIDSALMPWIDMASVACGGHSGDRLSMARAVQLAKSHGAMIGAHPSYPDRAHFGRRSLKHLPSDTLFSSLCQQVQDLLEVCTAQNARLNYIKAHGALYNDAVHDPAIFRLLVKLAEQFSLPLLILAHPRNNEHRNMAGKVVLLFEAFADRAYTDSGELLARTQPKAVFDSLEQVVEQARRIRDEGRVLSAQGHWLAVKADALCLHSDSPNAVEVARALHRQLHVAAP